MFGPSGLLSSQMRLNGGQAQLPSRSPVHLLGKARKGKWRVTAAPGGPQRDRRHQVRCRPTGGGGPPGVEHRAVPGTARRVPPVHSVLIPRARPGLRDRKSTRLNSSHANISYAVFCLKKKKKCHI